MQVQAAIVLILVFFMLLAYGVPVSFSTGNDYYVFKPWVWHVYLSPEAGGGH